MATAAAGADDGFGENSAFPIEVREAVLTTAAIDVAVIPFEGFSAVDEPSNATSSDVGTCIGAHFSCKGPMMEILFIDAKL